MTIQLTPSLILTTEHAASRYGFGTLVHMPSIQDPNTDEASQVYGPADILTYDRTTQPAAHHVVRFANHLPLTGEGRDFINGYLSQ